MRVLVADDDRSMRMILCRTLELWDFEVVPAANGESAWKRLQETRPSIAIVDWMMPKLDGVGLCRRIRAAPQHAHMYILLVTSRDSQRDLVAAIDAGADDYLTKPFDVEELHARVNGGVRILKLQEGLAEQVTRLQAALAEVRHLHGLLPICSYCKRIRSEENDWEHMETYISQHADVQFTHGICPKCMAQALRECDARHA